MLSPLIFENYAFTLHFGLQSITSIFKQQTTSYKPPSMSYNKTFIIAEAGVNHNGNLDIAIEMVVVATAAGADAIKFQTFKAEKVIAINAPKAGYQMETTGSDESQLEMVKKLELDEAAHKILLNHCRDKGIRFLSTPFDLDSIDLLNRLGLNIFKIPSGEITNLPYLRKLGALNKQLILSTGMADLGEIEDALDVLTDSGTPLENITLLHCNTEYPTPFEDVNLRAMQTIGHAFGVAVGYSDHTPGIEVAVAAVALGATVIEKHFTLDRNLPGPDHKASLEPVELKAMVQAIRNIEKAIGNGFKRPSPSEQKNKSIARKSLVAPQPIKTGERFSSCNITAKRPGTGISPMRWDEVLEQIAQKDYDKDDLI
jgi:N,N'-diacetyllegionaminate synthase